MEASTDQTRASDAAPPYETLPTPPAQSPLTSHSQSEISTAMDLDTVMSQAASSPRALNTPSPADIEVAHVLGGLRSGTITSGPLSVPIGTMASACS